VGQQIMTWQDWTIVALLAGLTSVAGGEVIVSHMAKPHALQVAKSAARNSPGDERSRTAPEPAATRPASP
jgi:hypothetical protein